MHEREPTDDSARLFCCLCLFSNAPETIHVARRILLSPGVASFSLGQQRKVQYVTLCIILPYIQCAEGMLLTAC